LVLLASISAFGQTNPSTQERPRRALPTEPEPQDIIKVDTDLVPLDVVATDAKGRLARNLKKEDFKALTKMGSSGRLLHSISRKSKARCVRWRSSSRLTSQAA